MDKRGISPIVATVLMILLVIVGISAVFVSVREVSQQTSSVPVVQQCLTLNARAESCVIDATGEDKSVQVKVVRGTGEGELSMIKILFDTPEGLKVQEESVSLGPLEAMVFTYQDPELLESTEVDVLGVIDGNLCRATGSPVKCVAGEIEGPESQKTIGEPDYISFKCTNYPVVNTCDFRISMHNGYNDYIPPPQLNRLYETYRVRFDSITLSGTSVAAPNGISFEEYFTTTKEEVFDSLENFVKQNKIDRATTDLLVVHIENPITQASLGEFLEEQGIENFTLYVNGTKTRLAAVREFFPNARISISATIRPFGKGDVPKEGFERMMKGYFTANDLGMYEKLDYLTPTVFVTLGDKEKGYKFIENITQVAVDNRLSIKYGGGLGGTSGTGGVFVRNPPIAPYLSIEVINALERVPPDIARRQVENLQRNLRSDDAILIWFGPNSNRYLYDYLEDGKIVPCSCFE